MSHYNNPGPYAQWCPKCQQTRRHGLIQQGMSTCVTCGTALEPHNGQEDRVTLEDILDMQRQELYAYVGELVLRDMGAVDVAEIRRLIALFRVNQGLAGIVGTERPMLRRLVDWTINRRRRT